jgi:hypothetical protein
MTCEGCGAFTPKDTRKWYGKWLLCSACKGRSVTQGWLPPSRTPDDTARLQADCAALRENA